MESKTFVPYEIVDLLLFMVCACPLFFELHSSDGEHDNCATPYKKEDLSVDKIGISQTSSHK